jgi:hypothetical protein
MIATLREGRLRGPGEAARAAELMRRVKNAEPGTARARRRLSARAAG